MDGPKPSEFRRLVAFLRTGKGPLPGWVSAEMLLKDEFAETRGWHPRQVDDLTLDELYQLPLIIRAKAEARREHPAPPAAGGAAGTRIVGGTMAASRRMPR